MAEQKTSNIQYRTLNAEQTGFGGGFFGRRNSLSLRVRTRAPTRY
jgi:hypothetical protein